MKIKQEQTASICRQFSAVELYSFGSRSREVFSFVQGQMESLSESASDIDIGVRFRQGVIPGPEEKVKLTIKFEELFQGAVVDLVLLEEAPAFLALDIIRGELLYAEDLDVQAEYELFVMARAGDLAYFERERRKNNLMVRQ